VRFMAAHREQNLEDLCQMIRANSARVYGSWGIEGF
jgi:hydrolase, tatD family